MESKRRQNTIFYIAILAGCFAVGYSAGFTPIGKRIDNAAYDWLANYATSVEAGSLTTSAVVVAIDERTLRAMHGVRNVRRILAGALDQIQEAGPKVVAIDVVLADPTDDADDKRLAAALLATSHLVLPCELIDGKWEYPLPEFMATDVKLGHVDLVEKSVDGVNRQIPLEKISGHVRHWALSLEAFSVFTGQPVSDNTADADLDVGSLHIPEPKDAADRPMMIRYLPAGTIPTISVLDIAQNRERIHGSAVFLGITALSAAVDRLMNSYGENVSGVAVHAQAFETIRRRYFMVPAEPTYVLGLCLGFTIAAGLIFVFVPGWWAYVVDLLLLGSAFWIPYQSFQHKVVFAFFAPASVAWLASASAATFQYFFVRRQLRTSESEKSRYQQAIHWVAHEMRTPLTAIQGSSEIMTRYKLPEEKGKQLSEMINSESKRLARMIQTFLDVERLADGQMELKKESFPASDVVDSCLKRVGPIAERKNIKIYLDTAVEAVLTGDRELMEYAFYNLLTNAVKYSPAETEIHVAAILSGGELRLSVRDQGIGMDAQELKSIFKKFYRTKRAEASGEVGTGIGLSIVEQIVSHHHGRMDVISEPGKGSCFTIILTASSPQVPKAADNSADSHNAETFNR
ncbi:MAG TPA: CHASE2 domain-containing protein [Bryobacteraceae bacterium]|nr:CHASE2 domain-containing protein [Bryobacteraceae bacterium]